MKEPVGLHVYNVGAGRGYPVADIFQLVQDITGMKAVCNVPGDITEPTPFSVADCGKAQQELGWKPETEIIKGLEYTIRNSRMSIK